MKLPENSMVYEVEPFWFIKVGERLVWPVDPEKKATHAEAVAELPAFPGGSLVDCKFLVSFPGPDDGGECCEIN